MTTLGGTPVGDLWSWEPAYERLLSAPPFEATPRECGLFFLPDGGMLGSGVAEPCPDRGRTWTRACLPEKGAMELRTGSSTVGLGSKPLCLV